MNKIVVILTTTLEENRLVTILGNAYDILVIGVIKATLDNNYIFNYIVRE